MTCITKGVKVIIIGVGIGGLSTALALRRVGVEPDVFEQAEELRLDERPIRNQPTSGLRPARQPPRPFVTTLVTTYHAFPHALFEEKPSKMRFVTTSRPAQAVQLTVAKASLCGLEKNAGASKLVARRPNE